MSKPKILEIEELSKEKRLYKNDEGSNGIITLSENTADFDWIDIVGGANGTEKTFRVKNFKNSLGKIVTESLWYESGSLHITIFFKLAINGNKITPVTANCGYWSINYLNKAVDMILDQTNYFKITEVIAGYDHIKEKEGEG